MLAIRLTRTGKKNSPSYRVVVADKKRAVKRKFIEIIGHYNPTLKPKQLVINKDRALFWVGNGAQASDTVNNLMVDLGILAKDKKIKKVYGKEMSKKAAKERPAAPKMESEKNEPQKDAEIAEVVEPEAALKEPAVEATAEAPAKENVTENVEANKPTEENIKPEEKE